MNNILPTDCHICSSWLHCYYWKLNRCITVIWIIAFSQFSWTPHCIQSLVSKLLFWMFLIMKLCIEACRIRGHPQPCSIIVFCTYVQSTSPQRRLIMVKHKVKLLLLFIVMTFLVLHKRTPYEEGSREGDVNKHMQSFQCRYVWVNRTFILAILQ